MNKDWSVMKKELVDGAFVSRVIAKDLTIQEAQVKCWETGGFAVMNGSLVVKLYPDNEGVENG